jgi:hypothetical protein
MQNYLLELFEQELKLFHKHIKQGLHYSFRYIILDDIIPNQLSILDSNIVVYSIKYKVQVIYIQAMVFQLNQPIFRFQRVL